MRSRLWSYVEAARVLARERGTSVLSEWLGLVRFRWRSGKGPSIYTLYRLFDVPSRRWGEYLDSRDMIALQRRVNDREFWPIVDDKLRFHDRCKAAGLPTPDVLAVIHGHKGTPQHHRRLDDAATFARFIRGGGPRDLVLKMGGGAYGRGFFAVRWDGHALLDLATGQAFAPEVFFPLIDAASPPYLVQPRLRRAECLAEVMPGDALGTVRVVTYRTRTDAVRIPYAFIKLPVTGQVLDNFSHGTSGNLLCGIDVTTGRMMSAFHRPAGKFILAKVDAHPETGKQILGREVPHWPVIMDLCREASAVFAELRTLGWDVAITDHGLCLIEANKTYDPDGMQITLERGIRTELMALFQL